MTRFATLALALAGIFASASPLSAAAPPAALAHSAAETYIVRFVEPGSMYYDGGNAGLEATSLEATGARRFNDRTPAAQAYRNHLLELHTQRQLQIESTLGRAAEVQHNYYLLYSGIALDLNAQEAERLRGLPGIESVEPAGTYELTTDAGPAFIGANSVWNGAATGLPNRGEGVVIGVLDGGANSTHPSYANDPSCGFTAMFPKQISAVDCLAANCIGGNPEDTTTTGHGVHTASTAAGNHLVPPLQSPAGVPLRYEMSGVAPCGRIRHYKVCGSSTCSGAAIAAAIQRGISDQINVMNFSISGGSNPWVDNDRGFLDMVNADIFVAASAGNTRPETPDPVGNVNHRGPWVMSVANSTHNRALVASLSVAGSLQNVGAQAGTGPDLQPTVAQVASSTVLGNTLGCNPGFAPNSMTGRLALIQRGTCPFAEKVTNAANAGAVGVILYMADGTAPIPPGGLGTTTIGAMMISLADGTTINNFVTANPSALATAQSGADFNVAYGDILNDGSLRGPNNSFDVTKPDITAPGTDIYAAVSVSGGDFGFLTGTSMSGPHVAGAGMLVRAAHPTWTPQEVKSALQLSANQNAGLKDSLLAPWDPDDVGNGRARVNLAVQSGLVMNETFANFLAANPANAGQPRNLNLPSMRHTSCNGSCTFTRTFRNTKNTPVTWNAIVNQAPPGTQITVTPASFSFTGNTNETQTVTIQIAISQPPPGLPSLSFGYLVFRDAGGTLPDASLTVAVRGTSDVLFSNGFEN